MDDTHLALHSTLLSARSIETATGSVPADALGFVLPHEHLIWGDAGWQFDTVEPMPDEAVVESITEVLAATAATGVQTIIDPTPPEMGRDVAIMAEVSRRTALNVVFATGVYCRWSTPYFAHRSPEELADFFATELTDGVGPHAAKPAFIKLAIDSADFTDYERNALVAAARVHRELDTPVLVHCQPGVGLDVLHLLVEDQGVDGRAVVVGHAEGVADLAHHLAIVERYGASVGFDRFGLSTFGVQDNIRVGLIVALAALGHADRIHLSHDYACINRGRTAEMLTERRASMPDWHPTWVPSAIVPRLRDAGVTERNLRLMTETGPARWLARAL